MLARVIAFIAQLWRDETPAHIKRRDEQQREVERRIRRAARMTSAADSFKRADRVTYHRS